MVKPLEGIKVLDLSRLLPGPYCSLILADLGADVTKIEDPNGGDYIRWMTPKMGDYSVSFMLLNRNKKSLTVNLKDPEGVELLKKMVVGADVLLESFRPGVMDRLGVGYETLSEINPRLVYCAITGYGVDGPYAQRAGHDINYLAISGLLSATGRPGTAPAPLPVQVADLAGGSLFGAIGILAALTARQQTGKGAFVDSSMTDGAAALGLINFAAYWGTGRNPSCCTEELNGGLACYEVYETSDGRFISLGALEPKFFAQFAEAVGQPDLVIEQFDTGEKKDALYKKVSEIFKSKTFDEWREFMAGYDFCGEPILTAAEACEDPQLIAREMFFEIDNGAGEKIKQLATPFKISGTDPAGREPPPGLGQQTEQILNDLGYSSEQISELRRKKVI